MLKTLMKICTRLMINFILPHEDDSKTDDMPNSIPLLVVPYVEEEQNARLLEEECAYHIPTNTPCDDSIPTLAE